MKKALFIRRDNIGDLVCTTPAIRAFKVAHPECGVSVLVNSYNAEVVANNPDVDKVFVYEKAKHSGAALSSHLKNLALFMRLRRERFDVAFACSYDYSQRAARLAFLSGARLRVGYATAKDASARIFLNRPLPAPPDGLHEVEGIIGLLAPFGVKSTPPKMVLNPLPSEREKALLYLKRTGLKNPEDAVIFQISSRKPENRWPVERYKELAVLIDDRLKLPVILLWSPGDSRNKFHPGDDEAAEWLISNMKTRPYPYRTESLSELVAVMSFGAVAVTPDGGAMHMAAALGKPIVAVWGSTDPAKWAPWGVRHRILQKGSLKASDVTAEEAFSALMSLLSGAGQKGGSK
ncbi:MAG: hypothetical protein A2X99_01505 [Deltaproteobacteria bacterium GWB2_55_19]|nr:MAG: hypothetical protein A2X99_01505 [Deltaproteobacteria bacterium GWB2_55_19]HAO93757.1 hypothetical protein [Deltaproteobacteria bacterium]